MLSWAAGLTVKVGGCQEAESLAACTAAVSEVFWHHYLSHGSKQWQATCVCIINVQILLFNLIHQRMQSMPCCPQPCNPV